MAIARGAGTEIIRSAYFEDVDSADTKLIIGVQHHIYTVLNINIRCYANVGGTSMFHLYLKVYDSKGATSAQSICLMEQLISVGETFTWNDKFSFNGFEPDNSEMSGALSTAAEQDAIADQGSAVSQYLFCGTDQGADNFEVGITYIDQNNA